MVLYFSQPHIKQIKFICINIFRFSKRKCLVLTGFLFLLWYIYKNSKSDGKFELFLVRLTKNAKKLSLLEANLEKSLKYDKRMGCEFPHLEPDDLTHYDGDIPKIMCKSLELDWVKCHMSRCKITKYVNENFGSVQCKFRDILYDSNKKYPVLSAPVTVNETNSYEYILNNSDHVKVDCYGYKPENIHFKSTWNGHAIGLREVIPNPSPKNRKDTINILIFGFNSVSRNSFMKRMPNSYKMLNETMNAHIFQGYSIVGDGTAACLFPLLTGKTELELPDVQHSMSNDGKVDSMPWIWSKLKNDGYRTAFFKDEPKIGTFQYRFNGFGLQPTDHYLWPYFLVGYPIRRCVGDTPTHKLMMDIARDFHTLPGKKFSFTWIVGVSHDNFNGVSVADDDFTEFLSSYYNGNLVNDTLLIVMADHGPRYNGFNYPMFRNTLTGKIEERLPFLSIVLPKILKTSRPNIEEVLRQNEEVIVTAHDIHATILDALDWREHWNPYKVKGADSTRGLTLFEPIPRSRSCSEAGIEPHWCPCLRWENVTVSDKLYRGVAESFVEYINELTEGLRNSCVPRFLLSIELVQKQKLHDNLDTYTQGGLQRNVESDTSYQTQNYHIEVTVAPNNGIFEAMAVYNTKVKKFTFNQNNITRINAYGSESQCISDKNSSILPFCYCTGQDHGRNNIEKH